MILTSSLGFSEFVGAMIVDCTWEWVRESDQLFDVGLIATSKNEEA